MIPPNSPKTLTARIILKRTLKTVLGPRYHDLVVKEVSVVRHPGSDKVLPRYDFIVETCDSAILSSSIKKGKVYARGCIIELGAIRKCARLLAECIRIDVLEKP